MNLPDVKDLAKVIDLCQKKGVKVFQMGELRLELGEPPVKQSAPRFQESVPQNETDPEDPWANFPNGVLSPEQLMFYSAGGKPGDEPWLTKKGADE